MRGSMDIKNVGKLQQYAHRKRVECKQKDYVGWRKIERKALKEGMKTCK